MSLRIIAPPHSPQGRVVSYTLGVFKVYLERVIV